MFADNNVIMQHTKESSILSYSFFFDKILLIIIITLIFLVTNQIKKPMPIGK